MHGARSGGKGGGRRGEPPPPRAPGRWGRDYWDPRAAESGTPSVGNPLADAVPWRSWASRAGGEGGGELPCIPAASAAGLAGGAGGGCRRGSPVPRFRLWFFPADVGIFWQRGEKPYPSGVLAAHRFSTATAARVCRSEQSARPEAALLHLLYLFGVLGVFNGDQLKRDFFFHCTFLQ